MTVASGQSSGGPGIFQLIRITLFGMPSTFSLGQAGQATFFNVVELPKFMKLVSRGVKSHIPLLSAFLLEQGLTSNTEKHLHIWFVCWQVRKRAVGERVFEF